MTSKRATQRCIAVMAKEPRPGQVKTRLAADMGDVAAAELCSAFLEDTLRHVQGVPQTARTLFFSPPASADTFRALDPAATLLPQPDAAFGERLRVGFDALFDAGHGRVLFIGCDTPQLSSATIESAFEALEQHDLVLGPCLDGGYYLIGLKARRPALFEDIPWSTERVLGATRERAKSLGLDLHELPTNFDVDDLADLRQLEALLAANPDLCPASAVQLGLRD